MDAIDYLIREIVGDRAAFDFFDEFLKERQRWEKPTLPVAYQAIQYFRIPKDTFIEYNNEAIAIDIKNGWDPTRNYQDWMIDALYCGDEEEMIRRLIVPSAMYRNGELFNIYDILDLDDAELEALALTTEEWRKFTRRAEWALKSHAPMAFLDEDLDIWAQHYSRNAGQYILAAQHENRSCLEVVEHKISEFEAQRNAVEGPCVQ